MIESYSQALILGGIQGVAEFLPISSSAHLALAEHYLQLPQKGRILEVALHLGTFLAVTIYFLRTFLGMLSGTLQGIRHRTMTPGAHQVVAIAIATLPAIIVGVVVHKVLPHGGNIFMIMGVMSLVGAGLLYAADRTSIAHATLDHLPLKHAIIIGFWQCGALLPGGSRLGMTLSGARFLGYDRTAAITFSYWLSVPVTLGALVLEGYGLYKSDGLTFITTQITGPLVVAIALAFVVGLSLMGLMLAWLKRHSFLPFILYRVIFGVVMLALSYGLIS